jgi:ferritin-like metal-binding protein YciE
MASLTDQITAFFSGNDSAADEGLRDLFITELKSVYYVERKIVDSLGKQINAATSDEVQAAFLHHQEETRTQVTRLEEIFRILSIAAGQHTNKAVDGLIDDVQFVIDDTETGSLTRDAALIIAAQKIEHLEIASYGSLLTLARVLGFDQSAELLAQTLDEEKATDKKLTSLAESFVNQQARDEETPGSHHESRAPHFDPDDPNNNVTLGGTLGI